MLPTTLDYCTPDTPDPRKYTRGSVGRRVWIAGILYGMSLVTPALVSGSRGSPAVHEVMMGWTLAFAGEFGWLAPVVNVLFIATVALAVVASRGGTHANALAFTSRVIASLVVPVAVAGIVAVLLMVCMSNGWGGSLTRPSIGMALWLAAYLVLGLRLRRWREA